MPAYKTRSNQFCCLMMSECTVHSCISSRECQSKHFSVVLLRELVCSFTFLSASCCHQRRRENLHGGAFLTKFHLPALLQSRWAVPSYPHRHVWYFWLAVVLLQHFSVEKLSAGLYHRGWRPKDLRYFSYHRNITWCGGSACREEGFSIYQSLLFHVPGRKRGPEGRSCSVLHSLSTLLFS